MSHSPRVFSSTRYWFTRSLSPIFTGVAMAVTFFSSALRFFSSFASSSFSSSASFLTSASSLSAFVTWLFSLSESLSYASFTEVTVSASSGVSLSASGRLSIRLMIAFVSASAVVCTVSFRFSVFPSRLVTAISSSVPSVTVISPSTGVRPSDPRSPLL